MYSQCRDFDVCKDDYPDWCSKNYLKCYEPECKEAPYCSEYRKYPSWCWSNDLKCYEDECRYAKHCQEYLKKKDDERKDEFPGWCWNKDSDGYKWCYHEDCWDAYWCREYRNKKDEYPSWCKDKDSKGYYRWCDYDDCEDASWCRAERQDRRDDGPDFGGDSGDGFYESGEKESYKEFERGREKCKTKNQYKPCEHEITICAELEWGECKEKCEKPKCGGEICVEVCNK